MAISQLLTQEDGSAGRPKADRRPVPNLLQFVQAIEWNNIVAAVIGLLAAVGLTDASTADSLLQQLDAFRGPLGTKWAVFEDFVWFDTSTTANGRVVVAVTGTGTCGGAAATVASDGSGIVRQTLGAGAGTAVVGLGAQKTLGGGGDPSCEVRVKTPAAMTSCSWHAGLGGVAAVSYAMIGWTNTSALRLLLLSATGGAAAANIDTGYVLTVDTWYTIKLVTSGTSTLVYVNGALVYTHAVAGTAVRLGDSMLPWHATLTYVAAAAQVDIDYVILRGTRV